MRETEVLIAKVVVPPSGVTAEQVIPTDLVNLAVRHRKLRPTPAREGPGLPVLGHAKSARVFGLEDVERALDEET
jgi:hypothetical protein